MSGKWIQEATAKNKGSFKAAAKKAGKGTMEFAREKESAGGVTGRRARLALTLSKLRGGRKSGGRSSGRSR